LYTLVAYIISALCLQKHTFKFVIFSTDFSACLLHTADSQFGDISGCTVADLGCGCGILSIGAALLGASYVLGVDLDEGKYVLLLRYYNH